MSNFKGPLQVEEALANAYDAFLSILRACMERGESLPEGPHLIALRKLPELPLQGIKPKAGRKGQGRVQRKELLVPVPA